MFYSSHVLESPNDTPTSFRVKSRGDPSRGVLNTYRRGNDSTTVTPTTVSSLSSSFTRKHPMGGARSLTWDRPRGRREGYRDTSVTTKCLLL